jgi:hypothetical protein
LAKQHLALDSWAPSFSFSGNGCGDITTHWGVLLMLLQQLVRRWPQNPSSGYYYMCKRWHSSIWTPEVSLSKGPSAVIFLKASAHQVWPTANRKSQWVVCSGE